jgi:hypothetical protein
VHEWVRRRLQPHQWPVVAGVLAPSSTQERPTATTPALPPQPPSAAVADDSVAGVLQRLRLASVDRLLREVRSVTREQTRADVLAELRGLGPRVRWFGRSIVVWLEVRR